MNIYLKYKKIKTLRIEIFTQENLKKLFKTFIINYIHINFEPKIIELYFLVQYFWSRIL